MGEISILDAILAVTIVSIGSFLQSTSGYGLGVIAVPLLLLVNPSWVPGPVLCAGLALTLLMLRREREAMDISGSKRGIPAYLFGSLAGATILSSLPQSEVIITSGILILFAVTLSLVGFNIKPTTILVIFAGTLSGLMSTLASIGGPPIALVYQNSPGSRIRSTLAGFFTVGSLISIISLAIVNRFGVKEILYSLILIPGILIGFIFSKRYLLFFDREIIRITILTTSTLAALAIILRELAR